MRRDGHLYGKYDRYASGTSVVKTLFLVVLEVVLHAMFCEMRISDRQETFTDVHINNLLYSYLSVWVFWRLDVLM